MRKYRKKPLIIEAIKYTNTPDNLKQLQEFVLLGSLSLYGNRLNINTLEGEVTATPGDYIIKGIKGEFYPCKPDIFEATYEVINE